MLGFGTPTNRQTRSEWWRRQIQYQKDGKLSVAEFCRRLGVSTVTFYAWKRRFREVPPASPVISESRTAQPTRTTNGAATAPFLPVAILGTGPAGQLEIELANACVLRLTGAVDPELLRIAIGTAGQLGSGGGAH
jgi:transposase-like protein